MRYHMSIPESVGSACENYGGRAADGRPVAHNPEADAPPISCKIDG